LWVDGRYHVQAAVQVDDNWTIMKEGTFQHKNIILLGIFIQIGRLTVEY